MVDVTGREKLVDELQVRFEAVKTATLASFTLDTNALENIAIYGVLKGQLEVLMNDHWVAIVDTHAAKVTLMAETENEDYTD